MRFRNPKLSGTVGPSVEKSIACDAVESQVIDNVRSRQRQIATVAVTDGKTSEFFGLVAIDAWAASDGFIDCNRARQPSGSSITCICAIVRPARNFISYGFACIPSVRCQGSVF